MQTALVLTAIVLSTAYASWRIYRAIRRANDPCAGCEGCALIDAKRKNGKNEDCKQKK